MRRPQVFSAASAALGAALALAAATSASAELFRCVGPDGKLVYTDQKALCPGADPHEPSGTVLPLEPTPAPARPAASAPAEPALDPGTEAAMAAHWQQKKRDAEDVVAQIQQRRDWMQPYVGHCNRGGYVTTRDEAGIKQVVNCSVLRREFDSLEQQEAAARDYLSRGLRDECRKAGCLPGWIR